MFKENLSETGIRQSNGNSLFRQAAPYKVDFLLRYVFNTMKILLLIHGKGKMSTQHLTETDIGPSNGRIAFTWWG